MTIHLHPSPHHDPNPGDGMCRRRVGDRFLHPAVSCPRLSLARGRTRRSGCQRLPTAGTVDTTRPRCGQDVKMPASGKRCRTHLLLPGIWFQSSPRDGGNAWIYADEIVHEVLPSMDHGVRPRIPDGPASSPTSSDYYLVVATWTWNTKSGVGPNGVRSTVQAVAVSSESTWIPAGSLVCCTVLRTAPLCGVRSTVCILPGQPVVSGPQIIVIVLLLSSLSLLLGCCSAPHFRTPYTVSKYTIIINNTSPSTAPAIFGSSLSLSFFFLGIAPIT